MSTPDRLTLFPGHPLYGTYQLPGDKSISHRAALLAAMAEGKSVIENFLVAGVTHVMLDALERLGVTYKIEGQVLSIQSPGVQGWPTPVDPLFCGSSATTMRLLAGALAASGISAVLDGTSGLRSRPMDRIIQPLRRMGVPIQGSNVDGAPLAIGQRSGNQPLRAIDCTLPVASAQVKSCVLLAGLAARGITTISEPARSRDHTERLLSYLGISVEQVSDSNRSAVRLTPPDCLRLQPFHLYVPGDQSSAAFLIVAALITPGSQITLTNVGLNPTRTGLLDILRDMGGAIEILETSLNGLEPVGDLRISHSSLKPATISGSQVVRMIDEFPAFAIAAAFADGISTVRDASELRLKESDRIGMLVGELSRLGIHASETGDGFAIHGDCLPVGGEVSSHADHRLAMSLALAGLAAEGPVTVNGAEIIDETFPEFTAVLQQLGADVRMDPSL